MFADPEDDHQSRLLGQQVVRPAQRVEVTSVGGSEYAGECTVPVVPALPLVQSHQAEGLLAAYTNSIHYRNRARRPRLTDVVQYKPVQIPGEVTEWTMVAVLKTAVGQLTVGSNPTLSAK
jgi:hypothetical protein